MNLAELYPTVRQLHLVAVGLSLTLFALRGAAVLAGARWPLAPALGRTTALIDTLLLAAGITLWVTLGLNPLHDTWLGAKLLLLLAYIVLGTLALRRARSRRAQWRCYGLALACAAQMVATAITHHPAGLWRWLA